MTGRLGVPHGIGTARIDLLVWLLCVLLLVGVSGPRSVSAGTSAATRLSRPIQAAVIGELDADAATTRGVLAVGTFSRYVTNPPCGQVFTTTAVGGAWRSQFIGGSVSHLCAWLTAVTADPQGGAWAVGYYIDRSGVQNLIERFNGSSWSVVSSPHPGSQSVLDGIVVGPNHQVWAVGQYQEPNSGIRIGASKTLTMVNAGSGWRLVPSPNPHGSTNCALFGVTVSSTGQVWAVGYAVQIQGIQLARHTLTMVYRAGSWQVVPSPGPGSNAQPRGNLLYSVSPAPRGSLWAVGYYLDSSLNTRTLTMFYDGSSWSVVASPSPGSGDAQFRAVVTTASGTVWAAGSFTGRRCTRTLTERYTGASWQIVHSPNPRCANPGNALYGLAADRAGGVYAVGVTNTHALLLTNRGSGWQAAVR